LEPGKNVSVAVNVTIPFNYPAGTYYSLIKASDSNGASDNVSLRITVLPNRTWSMSPTTCQRSQEPRVGTVCEVTVYNLGNDLIDFEITPSEANYTKVNETSFSVPSNSSHVFKIEYNVTDALVQVYNATYIVNATQVDADPDYLELYVTLLPHIPPLISYLVLPNETEQNTTVLIRVNVTDQSNSGIAFVKVNITKPDNQTETLNLTLDYVSGNLSSWYGYYTNTTLKGIYNLTIYAMDNIGNLGQNSTILLIYTRLQTTLSTFSTKYYQGDQGSIYYSLKDFENNSLANASIELTIKDPSNNLIFNLTALTNKDGIVEPIPTFKLADDALLGTYLLQAKTKYNDTSVNKTIEKIDVYYFEVYERTVTVEGLFSEIETAVVWYPENIMRFGLLFYTGEGSPVDPDQVNLTVYDPAEHVYFTVNKSDLTREAKGYYSYKYAMPLDTPTGMYLAVLNATLGEFQNLNLKAFRVASGGPYDVRLELMENEVPQGDYLDYVIIIENKGEVTQDVFVEYWISDELGNKYSSYSEAVLTPAHTLSSFTRSIYVPSTLPPGMHYLNAKVTYDRVQPPIYVNHTFFVVQTNVTPIQKTEKVTVVIPAPSPPTAKVTAPVEADLLIEKYSTNISIARGFSHVEIISVRNTGNLDLKNVTLEIIDLPTDWYNITPSKIATLEKDQVVNFVVMFSIPKNALPGSYSAAFFASSALVSDEKKFSLTVYKSLEELISEELKRVEDEYVELVADTKLAKKEGKDTTAVESLIDEIRKRMDNAESYFEAREFEKTLDELAKIKNLIQRARDILSSLETPTKPKKTFIPTLPFIPTYVLMILIIALPLVIVIILFVRKRKVKFKVTLPKIELGRKREEVPVDVEREIQRLRRLLEVLEREREEGIISLSAYNEMKRNISEKLKRLEKKKG
ncbi:MAG: hypothetical protein J7K83_02280, partial [Candidatus Aenigmarchaeota archaeon]|nr:hypothetical protein [Candidatus Aenigmarchaeota archaeon]